MDKKCLKCNQQKDLCYFHNNKNKKDGKDPYCKDCCKEYRLNNKKNIQITKKRYREKHLQKCLFLSAKNRAKRKNIKFDIEETDVIITEYCPILNIKLFVGDKFICENSPTLDRIDNEKGYIKGNIIVISNRANRLKNNSTLEEIEKIYNFYVRFK
jgi:hypothetical protein